MAGGRWDQLERMSCVHSGPRQSQYVNHLPSNDFSTHLLPTSHTYVKKKKQDIFRAGALHKIFSSSVYKLSTYHWPKHPAPTNGVIGWISENSWPQPCVTRCFLFTCFSSSNPPNQPMFACLCSHWSLLGEELFAFGGAASHVCCHFAKLEQSDRAQHSPPPVDSCC